MDISPQDLEDMGRELGFGGRVNPIPMAPPFHVIAEALGRYTQPRSWLLASWLFLTGQRITEALKTERKHISMANESERTWVVVRTKTLKNKVQPIRDIPFIYQSQANPVESAEAPLGQRVWQAIENLPPDAPLFNVSRGNAWNLLSKVAIRTTFIKADRSWYEGTLPLFPHFMRHARATNLASEHGYDTVKLMQFFGWSSFEMPNRYCSVNWRSLARGMIHN